MGFFFFFFDRLKVKKTKSDLFVDAGINTSTLFWFLGDIDVWFWWNKSTLESFSRYMKINILIIDTWGSSFSLWYYVMFQFRSQNQPDSFPVATKETGFHKMSLCLYQKESPVHRISSEQVNLPSLFRDKEIRCICCACLHSCHVYISFSQWPFLFFFFLPNIAFYSSKLSIHSLDWPSQWLHHIAYLI